MQLSGLVLDFYDDQGASVFKALYPAREDVPGLVKTAHALTADERDRLPDDVFALVLVQDDGSSIRKYACVDPGNTVLAVEYFLQNRHKLPEEAQKLAASNLSAACHWYDMAPPAELVKIALNVPALPSVGEVASASKGIGGKLMGAAGKVMGPVGTVMGWVGKAQTAAKGVGDVVKSRGIINPNIAKEAEVVGTALMPGQEDPGKNPPGTGKAVIKKTAATGHLVQGKAKHPQSEKPEQMEQGAWVQGKQEVPHQHKQLRPHINVQGAEPPSPTKMKVSSVTALRGRYPLDSYEQVKTASAYFDEYGMRFSPEDRREFCRNMVKRANDMRIPVSDIARKYASATYAPAEEIEFALDARRALLPDEVVPLLDKLSAARPVVDPDVFAYALYEMDKTAGLHHFYDRDLLDPFFSTFGFVKEATYSESIGNDYVNEFMLQQIAQSHYAWIKERFGEDVADEFRKDPVGIFKSLPMEQKKIIMRLSADVQPGRSES